MDGVKKSTTSRFQKVKGEGDPRGGILFLGVEKEDEWGRWSSEEEEGEGMECRSDGERRKSGCDEVMEKYVERI